MTLDDRMRAAIARLTDNEKECLRRRLLPQTAKEMALELGVSPHAIEKRLKMARTKLGLSSSLHAARLLVQSESHPLVPQASDLATDFAKPHPPVVPGDRRRWWIGGISAMSIMIAAALAATLTGTPAGQDGYDVDRLRPDTPMRLSAPARQDGPPKTKRKKAAPKRSPVSCPGASARWTRMVRAISKPRKHRGRRCAAKAGRRVT